MIDGTPMELVTAQDGTMTLRIPADYLFAVDAAQLRTEAPVRLDPPGAVLAKADRTLRVVAGYTDSLGTRGAGEMELRQRKEDSPAARQRNRRVEIEIRPFRPSRREAS